MARDNTAEKINDYPQPKRFERTLQLSEIEDNRNFTCYNYMNCLDTAINNNWQSFTCRECRRFENTDKKPKKTKIFEELKCLLLLKAIFI